MKKTILSNIGFDEKTEQVYRALLSLGDATVFRLSRHTGIKRTSIYHTLEKLIDIGLASTYTHRGIKRFSAEHPSKIKSFFEEKMILAERAIPFLLEEVQKKYRSADIRIFKGKEGIKSISEEILGSKEKKVRTIGSVARLLEATEGKFGYGERRRDKGIFSRSLRYRHDSWSTPLHPLTDIRILPDDFDFPGYIILFDNRVGIILFEEHHTGILITSDSFSRMMKSFFEILWEKSTPVQNNT